MRHMTVWMAAGALLLTASMAQAGSVFITGHDPVWHSNFGGNAAGAAKLAQVGIAYARNGSSSKFLFIESKNATIPSGNAQEAAFLDALGYSGQYDVMDAADLNALSNFGTTLAGYSAVVVASDHGGMLTGAELSFLNAHAADILAYINAGGGVMAQAESDAKGLITGNLPFGFLPFIVSSTSFQTLETSNTVTAFGASLGLANSDVNGNFSHNYFSSTGGMTAVDLYNGNSAFPLSLAFRGQFGVTGVVPLPPAAWMGLGLLGGLGILTRLRKRKPTTIV